MNLKDIRLSKGLSVPKLSVLAGVPVRTIENIERNRNAEVKTAIKLARALSVTLDELCKEPPSE